MTENHPKLAEHSFKEACHVKLIQHLKRIFSPKGVLYNLTRSDQASVTSSNCYENSRGET